MGIWLTDPSHPRRPAIRHDQTAPCHCGVVVENDGARRWRFTSPGRETGSGKVAVGPPVTRRPPPRSLRAVLPHKTPASGGDVLAMFRVGMSDSHRRHPAAGDPEKGVMERISYFGRQRKRSGSEFRILSAISLFFSLHVRTSFGSSDSDFNANLRTGTETLSALWIDKRSAIHESFCDVLHATATRPGLPRGRPAKSSRPPLSVLKCSTASLIILSASRTAWSFALHAPAAIFRHREAFRLQLIESSRKGFLEGLASPIPPLSQGALHRNLTDCLSLKL
jgi:hypothetical protein